jgi:hypothetical protein
MRTPFALLAALLLAPVLAVAQPAPGSVWGGSSGTFMERFNAAASSQGLRLNIGAVFCSVGHALDCDADAGGIRLGLRGTDNPEAVREVRILFQGSTPSAMVAAASHVVMQVAQPDAPAEERRAAVLGTLGLGGAARSGGTQVGQTEVRMRDRPRGGEVVFLMTAR